MACEGAVEDMRSSAETADDGVKKKHKKADRETDSPLVVGRESPGDIEADMEPRGGGNVVRPCPHRAPAQRAQLPLAWEHKEAEKSL